jgi:hypothetical protein
LAPLHHTQANMGEILWEGRGGPVEEYGTYSVCEGI